MKSGKLEDLIAEARGMDLVVLPHRHERSTAAFFYGQPVLRLLRRCNRPVLVVRKAHGERYERVLVAVDFSEASESLVKHARERFVSLTDSFDARRNRVLSAIGRGDPGRQTVIQQEHSGADVVVLGKKHSTAWEDFFCGSVAHRVLSWGSSDVLVVPDASLRATAPLAARRVATGVDRKAALPLQAPARRES